MLPKNAEKLVKACVALHHYFMLNNMFHFCTPKYVDQYFLNGEIINGEWSLEVPALPQAQIAGKFNASREGVFFVITSKVI